MHTFIVFSILICSFAIFYNHNANNSKLFLNHKKDSKKQEKYKVSCNVLTGELLTSAHYNFVLFTNERKLYNISIGAKYLCYFFEYFSPVYSHF